MWWPIWPQAHGVAQGLKRDPIPPFNFLVSTLPTIILSHIHSQSGIKFFHSCTTSWLDDPGGCTQLFFGGCVGALNIFWCVCGGHSTFFGGCVPHRFPKVGSREQILLEKWGALGTKIWKICILRAESLVKTRLKMQNFSKNWKWGTHEQCIDGKLVG